MHPEEKFELDKDFSISDWGSFSEKRQKMLDSFTTINKRMNERKKKLDEEFEKMERGMAESFKEIKDLKDLKFNGTEFTKSFSSNSFKKQTISPDGKIHTTDSAGTVKKCENGKCKSASAVCKDGKCK